MYVVHESRVSVFAARYRIGKELLLYQVNLAFGVIHTQSQELGRRMKVDKERERKKTRSWFTLVLPESFARELRERKREREGERKK